MPVKFNRFYHGFLGGLIITILVFIIFVLVNWERFGSFAKLWRFIRYGHMMSSLISLCAVPGLILFFYFMKTSRYNAAKGLIAITMVTAVAVYVLKFNTII